MMRVLLGTALVLIAVGCALLDTAMVVALG